MSPKNIIFVAVTVLVGICLFGAGVVVGALRASKVSQKQEAPLVVLTSYRAYKALESGDTERAKFWCGGLLATYTEKYDSVFPTGAASVPFERLLSEARQISQIARTNGFRRAFETNAENPQP
jgi:hypothetical protein